MPPVVGAFFRLRLAAMRGSSRSWCWRLNRTSRHSLGDRIEGFGEFHILRADSARIVGGQIDTDAVVHIEPLRMVAHGFNLHGSSCHEAEGMDEIRKLVFAMELPLRHGPSAEFAQCDGNFSPRELGLILGGRLWFHLFIVRYFATTCASRR